MDQWNTVYTRLPLKHTEVHQRKVSYYFVYEYHLSQQAPVSNNKGKMEVSVGWDLCCAVISDKNAKIRKLHILPT